MSAPFGGPKSWTLPIEIAIGESLEWTRTLPQGIDPGLVEYLVQYGASSIVAEVGRWTRLKTLAFDYRMYHDQRVQASECPYQLWQD